MFGCNYVIMQLCSFKYEILYFNYFLRSECDSSCCVTHHVTRHNTLFHNILLTAPQLSISQKALGTLPEDGNVMPKHVGATIYN
jgi:hypothetical protein